MLFVVMMCNGLGRDPVAKKEKNEVRVDNALVDVGPLSGDN